MFLCYDFEVFKHDWLIVIKNLVTGKYTKIVNDRDSLVEFYEKHKNFIWIGFNSRSYDSNIMKAILSGFNPYDMNEWVITNGRKGWEFSDSINKPQFYNYDVYLENRGSLKRLEGYLGLNIHESNVDFRIDRPLTQEEIEDTFKYCTHDVDCTEEVLCRRKGEFDVIWGLIKMFELPISYVSKTKVQVTEAILDAERKDLNDEWEFDLEPEHNLVRYKHVQDWFASPESRKQGAELKIRTKSGDGIVAWGGIHQCIEKYFSKNVHGYCVDIASMYPATMIEHNMFSRSCPDVSKFVKIRDQRLEFKRAKDKRANILKPAINGCYGAMGFKYSKLVDMRNMHRVCVFGQLALLELNELIEDLCKVTQLNTDGLYFELTDEELENGNLDKIKQICSDWEKSFKFDLEWEEYCALYQSNVNNYILVHHDGSTKCKGGMVKFNDPLDNDLSILNDAIREYFVNGVPPEKTIQDCDDFIKFQKIYHVSSLYKEALKNCTFRKESYIKEETGRKNTRTVWNNDGISFYERTFRVFASKDENEGALYKKKDDKNPEKFANCPEHCFIENGDIRGKKCLDYPQLDKQWYIDEAWKRIALFKSGK